jgi:DMSO/TMAO reductase YedYZ molybdopterin-dependent catalytic subunit
MTGEDGLGSRRGVASAPQKAGAYGKPVAKSQDAPLRLALPWKYGFKSIRRVTSPTRP